MPWLLIRRAAAFFLDMLLLFGSGLFGWPAEHP
jgi:hypothetical protein